MKSPLLGYLFDAFVIGCMTALVYIGACEMKDFFLVVGPIIGARVWQTRTGQLPPPGLGGSAVMIFLLPIAALFLDRKA